MVLQITLVDILLIARNARQLVKYRLLLSAKPSNKALHLRQAFILSQKYKNYYKKKTD